MKKMVVAFLDGVRKGSCMAVCDGFQPGQPATGEFEAEARRMMVADGGLTVEEGDRATFKVQD